MDYKFVKIVIQSIVIHDIPKDAHRGRHYYDAKKVSAQQRHLGWNRRRLSRMWKRNNNFLNEIKFQYRFVDQYTGYVCLCAWKKTFNYL